jgi:hypothetical protein
MRVLGGRDDIFGGVVPAKDLAVGAAVKQKWSTGEAATPEMKPAWNF